DPGPGQHLQHAAGVEGAVVDEPAGQHPAHRQHEEDRQDGQRDAGRHDTDDRRGRGAGATRRPGHQRVTTSFHSFSQVSRCWSIRAGSRSCGGSATSANRDQASGSSTSSLTGKTYMLSGSAAWNSPRAKKSTSACAPSGFAAPAMTPAYSTWRKQVSSNALVVGSSPSSGMVNGGEEA